MRGSQAIYASLFNDPPNLTIVSSTIKKGRDAVLVQKRNDCLIHRYYYLVKIESRQYIKTLEQLEDEFFISQRTITDIISDESAKLRQLHTAKPDAKYFKNLYPHINW
jgi:hypothetical protein